MGPLTLFDQPDHQPSFTRQPLSDWSSSPSPAESFRATFFPRVDLKTWNDWRWQLKHRITDIGLLAGMISLTADEKAAILRSKSRPPFALTPYYLSLVNPLDPSDPLRRTVLPSLAEEARSPGEAADPLAEEEDSPAPHLVHRYPDRVLLLATGFCSTYCRYCTRSRLVGRAGAAGFEQTDLEPALAYIEANPTIRDVLISGGDPLTLADKSLALLLDRLRRIKHLELIRIGTKAPVVLPQRITPSLTRILRRYHPLFISIHFTHPRELTPETHQACARLADAGLPLGSQTVLLAGVNDNLETLRSLFQGLLRFRVRPYYLYQCDPILGSAHFRTPVSRGLELIQGLRGHTTGYAVPSYVIDAPGGGGKIPLQPEYVAGRQGDELILRNYQGREFRYPDPLAARAN